jgi:YD repeat-containing protein
VQQCLLRSRREGAAESILGNLALPQKRRLTWGIDVGKIAMRYPTQRAGPHGQFVSRYAYDAAGNLTSITDPLSRVTGNTYDALGNSIQLTDPEFDPASAGIGQLLIPSRPALAR